MHCLDAATISNVQRYNSRDLENTIPKSIPCVYFPKLEFVLVEQIKSAEEVGASIYH